MEVRSILSRLIATLSLSLCVALLTGVARFIDYVHPGPLWLDILFLVSVGISVTLGVVILSLRMAHAARDRAFDDDPSHARRGDQGERGSK